MIPDAGELLQAELGIGDLAVQTAGFLFHQHIRQTVKGNLLRRRESVNKEIKTGEVEIEVTDLRVLAKSETPPFEIVDNTNVKEELRLKYRYLDLRRSPMPNWWNSR